MRDGCVKPWMGAPWVASPGVLSLVMRESSYAFDLGGVVAGVLCSVGGCAFMGGTALFGGSTTGFFWMSMFRLLCSTPRADSSSVWSSGAGVCALVHIPPHGTSRNVPAWNVSDCVCPRKEPHR
jgi:hypothetical protein